ncbi:family 20 glycosylhydrolase [Staphylococcus saprophyticus]
MGCHPEKLIRGVILDTSRRYISADSIKEVIDEITLAKGNYLQLHFSDSEGYSIYSEILGQTSNQMNDRYLTKQEVTEILKYANDRNIMIIPDFDVPSHSKGWLNLVKNKYGDPTYTTIVSDFDDNLVDYFGNEKAIAFVKELLNEITALFEQPMFSGKQIFSIGADEVSGTNNFQNDYINFVNAIAEHLKGKGYKTRMWNDSVNEEGIKLLDKDIEIVFWKQGYLPASRFVDEGFSIHNSNYNILTYGPSIDGTANNALSEQISYMKNIYDKDVFYYTDNPYFKVDTKTSLKGTAYTFWDERGYELTDNQLLVQLKTLVRQYLMLI